MLLSVARVCKVWCSLASHDLLWKNLFRSTWKWTPLGESNFRSSFLEREVQEAKWRKVLYSNGYLDRVFPFFGDISSHMQRSPIVKPKVKRRNIHDKRVGAMQFDRSENILVTGSKDKTIKITDTKTWKCKETLHGHGGDVYCVQFDSKKIISSSGDSTIKIWSLDQPNGKSQLLQTLNGHQGPISNIQFDDRKIVSCSDDRLIKIWDLSGKWIQDLHGHSDMIWTMTFQDSTIISGSHDLSLRIWDDREQSCKHALYVHDTAVRFVEIKDYVVVSGSNRGKVVASDIRRLSTGQKSESTFLEFTVPLKSNSNFLNCLKFDESKIITATESVKVYDWKGNMVNHYGSTFEMGDVLRIQYEGEYMITTGKTIMEWCIL